MYCLTEIVRLYRLRFTCFGPLPLGSYLLETEESQVPMQSQSLKKAGQMISDKLSALIFATSHSQN
jgi:hypothetical protein